MTGRSRGASLIELALAALIVGVSTIPILELLRSSTASVEITAAEAAARGLAADVLERLAGPPSLDGPQFPASRFGREVPWQDVFTEDAVLAKGLPLSHLESLLERHRVTLRIERDRDLSDPTWVTAKGLDRYRVRVRWVAAGEQVREATLVKLHAAQ